MTERNLFLDLVEGRAPEGYVLKYISLDPLHVEASHPDGGFIAYCDSKPESWEESLRQLPTCRTYMSTGEIGKITNVRFIFDK